MSMCGASPSMYELCVPERNREVVDGYVMKNRIRCNQRTNFVATARLNAATDR